MAKNTIINYYRSQNKTALIFQDDLINEDQVPLIQLADCSLLSFLKALPPAYSEALIFACLEGMSQRQLAVRLNISYTGAKARVQRARKIVNLAILDCCLYQFDNYVNITSCCK